MVLEFSAFGMGFKVASPYEKINFITLRKFEHAKYKIWISLLEMVRRS